MVEVSEKFISNTKLLDDLTFKENDGVYLSDASHVVKALKVNAFNSNDIVLDDYYGREHIKICKLIRKCAASRAIQIDTNDGLNIPLFETIKACDLDPMDFICGYLSVLQPFYLQSFSSREISKPAWLLEIGYKTVLLIKIKKRGMDLNKSVVVISFHERNRKDIGFSCVRSFKGKKCAVFVDDVYLSNNQIYIDFIIQKGLIRHYFERIPCEYKDGVAFLDYDIIYSKIEDDLQSWFRNMLDLCMSEDFAGIEVKDLDVNLSFASRGYAFINNLCLLIDVFAIVHDCNNRDFLMDLKDNLLSEIPEQSRIQIKEALWGRYLNSEGGSGINKMYNLIMEQL